MVTDATPSRAAPGRTAAGFSLGPRRGVFIDAAERGLRRTARRSML